RLSRSTLFPYTTLFRSEANAAAARLLRTPGDLLPGQSLAEFVVKADRERFRERLKDLHQGVMERLENWQVHLEPRHGSPIPAALDRKSTRLNSSHLGIS